MAKVIIDENNFDYHMKKLLTTSLILTEMLEETTIIEIYKKMMDEKPLTKNEESAMFMFYNLCSLEAFSPIFKVKEYINENS